MEYLVIVPDTPDPSTGIFGSSSAIYDADSPAEACVRRRFNEHRPGNLTESLPQCFSQQPDKGAGYHRRAAPRKRGRHDVENGVLAEAEFHRLVIDR